MIRTVSARPASIWPVPMASAERKPVQAAPTSIAPARLAPSAWATSGAAFGRMSSDVVVATSTRSTSVGLTPAAARARWPASAASSVSVSSAEAMWRELGESLAGADVVVVTDIYAAWEEPIPGVTGKLVVDALAEAAPGKRILYLPRRSDVGPQVASLARPGDRVVTLGAGDITMVADETLELIREASA